MPLFNVSAAAPHELLPACRLLFGAAGDGAAERMLSAPGSGLFVARSGGRVCAAALAQALLGALGLMCPPRGDPPEATDAAVRAACDWLRASGVKVCQAFAGADEVGLMAPLEHAGFRPITQLVFMRAPPGIGRAPVHEMDKRLRITFSAALPVADAHADTLVATHAGSLDCPELNAPRTATELVEGFYHAAGSEWYSATLDGKPVGLALVEPGDGELTLSYLGVVPEARGRGLGAELLGSILARVAGDRPLSVSVDARNTPAVNLYTKFGFTEHERRGVWLATWPT